MSKCASRPLPRGWRIVLSGSNISDVESLEDAHEIMCGQHLVRQEHSLSYRRAQVWLSGIS